MTYIGRDIAHQSLTRQQDKGSLLTVAVVAAGVYIIAACFKFGMAGGFIRAWAQLQEFAK